VPGEFLPKTCWCSLTPLCCSRRKCKIWRS
jgi:hypothetical protein